MSLQEIRALRADEVFRVGLEELQSAEPVPADGELVRLPEWGTSLQ